MLASLVSITSLMLSTLLMMVGFGLMNYMIPVRSLAEGWSTFLISIMATGYTLGFTISCVITPKLVQRVGHVRVFGALITLLTVAILACAMVVDWRAWMVFRGLAGFAIAGSYLIIESWLNERVTNDNRGTIFSVYMVTCLVGSIGGQYLVPLGDPETTQLFILCGIIFSLALFPTALSTAQSPSPIAQANFDLPKLYRVSPIAFVGSLLAGALSGTWASLGAVYTQTIGLTTAEGATLLASVLAGGAIAQMPIGRISDRIDRRQVMIACGGVGVAACTLMALVSSMNIYVISAASFFVGTVLYPIYALNVAHANDRAEPAEYVAISSGIMVLYGLGTVAGPVMGGAVMETTGPKGLLSFLALIFGFYAAYAAWRMNRRSPDEAPKTDFQSMPIPMQVTEGVTGQPGPGPDTGR
ncbi:MFS transporter [Rhizobiaceae bacterium n13]|uniref:MFS transporter n=1 Tax=Ferirhizobium litorale TaxID=2927786 RepID=A0AAE3QAG7_9HYPH|nr:MFS transporter [Fererhizobium litorale]MDI7861238.1 MFS transporter [Fererhizobium litorale]MDI7921385.1 MFS transporter [Fererhizobium litorale]